MRPGEFAKRVRISVKILHRWDETGKLLDCCDLDWRSPHRDNAIASWYTSR